MAHDIKWSSQFHTTSEPSQRLFGDKITLPQSALEALLAAAPITSLDEPHTVRHTPGFDPFNPYSFAAERQARDAIADRQHQLPHPLTFRLVNPQNGRIVYAGIREFSAEEGEIGLSRFLFDALGLGQSVTPKQGSGANTSHSDAMVIGKDDHKESRITVHAERLSKGEFVRLRPLEAGYDPDDWKSLLERYLRDSFTTLTKGEVIDVPGARKEHFRFLVDKFEPEEEGVCIVDTDLTVDIEALNEEQARETLNKRLAKAKRVPGSTSGSSQGGLVQIGQEYQGQVVPDGYVDYELKEWDKSQDLIVYLEGTDGADLDVLISPFSAQQRSRPRIDEHSFADFSGQSSKNLTVSHSNVALDDAELIYITVRAAPTIGSGASPPLRYSISVTNTTAEDQVHGITQDEPSSEEIRCKNCAQCIPKRTLPLHEAFCYRNNVVCPQCKNVFLKSSDAWKFHWHCPHDDYYGSGEAARTKHDSIFHPHSPLSCPACNFEAFDIPILAHHRTTTCPAKSILCQFCHLVVAQQGPEDPSFNEPEVLMSGLTPHEVSDGARTTDCHLCGKIVKLQNMKTHMKLHDRDRVLRPRPKLCINKICGRTIRPGRETQAEKEQLGLCDDCFGPLYNTTHDPEGKALRRRIERRLLQQLMGGCGKPWCHNTEWCRTGRKNSSGSDVVVPAKDALPIVKPVLDGLSKSDATNLSFCVDESTQSRRAMAEMLTAENTYELEWCVKALEEQRNNIGQARDWLKDRAPKKHETIA